MKIAFDVKGTIEGPKKELVLKLFRGFQNTGHECVVWSNSYGYAVDAIKNNNLLDTHPEDKKSKRDLEEYGRPVYDIAIEDDRSQTWLGAKRFVFVDELTEELVDQLVGVTR